VAGTPGGTNSTLEHIWAIILAVARHIVTEHRNIQVRNSIWQTIILFGLSGRTLGIIGLGRLGSEIAKIAKAFDMRVIAWSSNLTPERATENDHVDFVNSKEELLKQSDIVSLHIVLSERTRHLIGAPELVLMKPTAFIINTSRGPLIDEDALLKILKEKRIAVWTSLLSNPFLWIILCGH